MRSILTSDRHRVEQGGAERLSRGVGGAERVEQ